MLQTDEKIAVKLMNRFLEASLKVCEGQQWDMSYQSMAEVTIADYLKMIELKTATLLAFSLESGAIIARSSEEDQQHAFDFGKNLGIAFQLHDDILDVYGDEEKFGKQTGGDIIENKKTFLLLKAQEVANKKQLEQLRHWLSLEKFDKAEKVKAVKSIFEEVGVKALSEEVMEGYFEMAIESLDQVNISNERKTVLRNLAEALMVREH